MDLVSLDNILGIAAIVGEEGTCKTTMALSWPLKTVHFDLDVGGFKRAGWRLPTKTVIKLLAAHEPISNADPREFDILSKPYPKPVQLGRLLGAESKIVSSRIEVRFPRKVEGMAELWKDIVRDFVAVCQMPEVVTIILDSATMFWNIDHRGYLQELQEKQLLKWQSDSSHRGATFDENDYRERLQPIEYGEPNDRMTQVFHTARAFNKNLVLTHYPTDVYGPMPDGKGGMADAKTGQVTLDGYKNTGKLVDLVVWTSIKTHLVPDDITKPLGTKHEEKYPVAKITKAGIEGMGITAVGMEVPASFEGIINLRNMMRGAARNG